MPAFCMRPSFRRWPLAMFIGIVLGLLPFSASAQNIPFAVPAQLSTGLSYAIGILYVLTWIVFYYLNILLDPVIIFDLSGGALTDLLNQIWIFSRDLVNVVFAFVLIGAAIYTTVRAQNIITEHWKKFVAAVILVNFSWFLPRVIFDVANVTAAAIFNLPSLMLSAENSCSTIMSKNVWADTDYSNKCQEVNPGRWRCACAYISDFRPFPSPQEVGQFKDIPQKSKGWRCEMGGLICYQRQPLDPSAVSGRATILNGLIINHAYLQTLADVPPPAGGGTDIRLVLMFLVRAAFILIFLVLLCFPLAALAVAFFIRIPVLWLTMALMPFAVLRFVLPSSEFLGEIGGYMKKITDSFLKAAFLPALVAAPLALGFILVNAGAGLSSDAINAMANVRITLFSSINNLYQLLWMLISMGVVWVGVFTVLQKIEFVSKFTEKIREQGSAFMRLGMRLPGFLPIPGTKMTILEGLGAMNAKNHQNATRIGHIQSTFQNKAGGGGANAGAGGGGAMPATLMNDQKARDLTSEMKRLTDAMKKNESKENLQRILDNMNRDHPNLDLSLQNLANRLPQLRDAVGRDRNKPGIDASVTQDLKNSIDDALKEASRKPPQQTPPSAPPSPPSAPSTQAPSGSAPPNPNP